jgi:hypothetical protein
MSHKKANQFFLAAAPALYLSLSLSLASCSGGDSLVPTVHTVGYECNDYGDPVFTYWTSKGAPKSLGDGVDSDWTECDIFVDDKNDVYCVGYQVDSSYPWGWLPAVWKNGARLYNLPLLSGMSEGYATGVFARGNDVYVAGCGYDGAWVPMLWKNAVPQRIGSSGAARSVFVSGDGNVYAAGIDDGVPAIWRNGAAMPLNNGTYGCVFSIAATSDGVYAVGFERDTRFGSDGRSARLWELSPGGALRSTKSIGAGTGSSSASGVYASDGDLYAALYEYSSYSSSANRSAKYYKNGSLHTLPGGERTAAFGISGHGGNVYVVGQERDAGKGFVVAKYWINGEPHTISSGNYPASASRIVVK